MSSRELVFLDTNVFLRYLTGDPSDQFARAHAFFQGVDQGQVLATTCEAVIAEVTWVLTSRRGPYRVDRVAAASALVDLLDLPGIILDEKVLYRRALNLFGSHRVDFADAVAVAHMERRGIGRIVSFDPDFDQFPSIVREEP